MSMRVPKHMWKACGWAVLASITAFSSAITAEYASARRKIDAIQSDRLPAGSRVTLTRAELNAYLRRELVPQFPDGVRNPAVELGNGTATGSVLVDFTRLRRSRGQEPGWLFERILNGEKPVLVRARIQSGGGHATVTVESVEISGVSVEGRVLDYLIDNYLIPNYPEAKVNTPFALGHRIERLDVAPAGVRVSITR